MISFFASVQPATSEKSTVTSSFLMSLALLLPIWKIPPMPPRPPPPAPGMPPMPRSMYAVIPMRNMAGADLTSSMAQLVSLAYWTGT